jgi:hypothetical protein
MAAQYYLYCTTLNNTVICRSDNSFAPLPPNTGELLYDILIPETQPLYLYRESGSTIIPNNQEYVEEYIDSELPPPTPDDYVKMSTLTGYTATTSGGTGGATWGSISGIITNQTDLNTCLNARALKSSISTYTGTTAPSIFVNVSGDTMTGSLSTSGNFTAGGLVSGSSVCGGVWVNSPLICGSTKVQSPIITGSTCVTSPRILGTTCVSAPITCGTTCVISPIVFGSTCVCSPTVCTSTCLCSTGTARFTGGVTAASFLNVSGATKLSSVGACQVVFGNQSTCQLTGNTAMVYNPTTCTLCTNYLQLTGNGAVLYAEKLTQQTNASTTCVKYLGLTGTSMVAGCYAVDFTGTFGTSGSNGETLVKFTCDNSIVGGKETYFRMSIAKAVQTASTFRNLTLSAGTHCFDIWFRSCASTACAEYGAIRIRRIC